jgi:hypothetical protein
MLKINRKCTPTRCGRLAAIALSGFITYGAIAALSDYAQAQAPRITKDTVAPYRTVPHLAAIPQIAAGVRAAPHMTKPFRHRLGAAAFAAKKTEAKAMRFTPPGVIPAGRPAPMGSGAHVAHPELMQQTVSPPELAFTATSDAQCAALSGFLVEPADQALAVGNTLASVVHGVNSCINLYDKNGNQQAGFPKSHNTFFGLGALNDSDPRAIFDWINHRFLYIIISFDNSCFNQCTSAAFYNLAVSNTNDPAGSWCLYQLPVATTPNPQPDGTFLLPDFPRLGQDREAVYIASNLFGVDFVAEEVQALRKTDLYACNPVTRSTVTGLTDSDNFFTIQPASIFSPYDDPKSMYFVASSANSSNQIKVSAFHDPFGTPTFTSVTVTGTNTYSLPPDATQQGGCSLIATNDQRISNSPFYVAGSIYASLATDGGNGEPGILSYQIKPFVDTSGGPNDGKIVGATILNEIAHFGANGTTDAFYYPGQLPDPEGNITTVFGTSNATSFASLAYASRRVGQAVGTEPDAGVIAGAGTACFDGGRWGDYFAAAPAGIVSGGGTGGFPKFWFSGMMAVVGDDWSNTIGRTGYSEINQNLPER